MDLKTFAEALDRYLRPETFPLAIRMVRPGEPLPENVKRPLADLESRMAICQGIAVARRYGWTLALTRDDVGCPLTRVAFGFDKEVEFYTAGEACCGMYTETAEAGRVTEAAVPKFSFSEYDALVAGPLARASFVPDVVLVYGNSAQVMRLVTAALFKRGGYLTSDFSGRIDCADIVVKTMQTGDCQVILPCYGDRVMAQTQDHEMAFTVPAARFEELTAGLEGTHRGGVRYPIPNFLRYSPEFPPKYQELDKLLIASRASRASRQA